MKNLKRNREATMNLTQDEVLELARENGFKIFDSMVEGCTPNLVKFASAITATLQEKSQGEAIYQKRGQFAWIETTKENFYKITNESHRRIVYLQPQLVKDMLEKAALIVEVEIENTNPDTGYLLGNIVDRIRALIDQPADQPEQPQGLEAYVDRLEWRLIESNKILEKEGIYSTNTFLNKKTLASKPTKG